MNFRLIQNPLFRSYRPLARLCLAIFVAGGATCLSLGVQAAAPSNSVVIQIKGVPSAEDKKLLQQKTKDYVSFLADSFVLPKKIFMANGPGGPVYKDEMVTLRYPFYESGETKTAEQSLAINLHEVSHYIFEQTMAQIYENYPEVLWGFFTRIDDMGSYNSLDLISKTKSKTKYKDMTDEKIQAIFAEYQPIGSLYNEIFADTMVAFFMQDPDAIFTSLYFEKLAHSNDPIDRAFQESHQLRRFNQAHDMDIARKALKDGSDPYAVLSPARQTLWQKVFVEYRAKHPEMSGGQILQRVMKNLVASFVQSTGSFSVKPNTITADQLNQDLIQSIQRAF